MSEIRELLQKIVEPMIKRQVIRATVTDVDTNDQTCTVVTDRGGERFEVKLRATGDQSDIGVIIYPKVDSEVLIGIISNNDADCFIAKYSEIDGILIKQGNNFSFELKTDGKVEIIADEIKFTGTINGLADIPSMVQRYNNIEFDLNTLKNIFAAWTPVPNDGGLALKGLITSWAGTTLTATNQNDINHDKIEWP